MDTTLGSTRRSHDLVMTWTEVPDDRGGTRLQARWVDASAPTSLAHEVPAAHAA